MVASCRSDVVSLRRDVALPQIDIRPAQVDITPWQVDVAPRQNHVAPRRRHAAPRQRETPPRSNDPNLRQMDVRVAGVCGSGSAQLALRLGPDAHEPLVITHARGFCAGFDGLRPLLTPKVDFRAIHVGGHLVGF